tara:strand:+ start:1953 stop:2222 length:270 start_codon:yes stop_codon:yes gene_type:complete
MADKSFSSISTAFQLTFSNGYTLSVAFGEHSYSDQGESTAEVAAWHYGEDHWLAFEGGTWQQLPQGETSVLGHQTPEQVAHHIKIISKL